MKGMQQPVFAGVRTRLIVPALSGQRTQTSLTHLHQVPARAACSQVRDEQNTSAIPKKVLRRRVRQITGQQSYVSRSQDGRGIRDPGIGWAHAGCERTHIWAEGRGLEGLKGEVTQLLGDEPSCLRTGRPSVGVHRGLWEPLESALTGQRDTAALWFKAEVVSRFSRSPCVESRQNAEGPPSVGTYPPSPRPCQPGSCHSWGWSVPPQAQWPAVHPPG